MTETRRPPSVTMACVYVGLTSLIVFGYLVSALSDWGSIELQESVRDALDDPAFDGVNLSVTEVIEWLRRIAYVVVFLSIAGIVFAVFAARGHRGSRVYLTVMCGLAFVGFVAVGGLAGLLPAALAVVCAMQLWSPESRAWFDAKNGVTPARPAEPIVVPAAAPAAVAAPTRELAKPERIAGLVTMIGSWLVVMFSAYFVLVYTTARESYVDSISKGSTRRAFDDLGVEPSDFVTWMFIYFVVCGVLALLACASAALLLRGVSRARTTTMVLAVVSLPMSVALVGVGWPWTAAAIVVIVMLNKREARV
ncbi:hypothetical protein GCM10022234_19710 [Aeromicrobium panaciterrae]|uniref:hypothetical protein n=1 Tax=Aeromicrobium panaciterrae TaxID=363861 RepID=UPI0031D79F76